MILRNIEPPVDDDYNMATPLLHPRTAQLQADGDGSSTKARVIKAAKEMQAIVNEKSQRLNLALPPYDFEELIGKGSYGRVFKSTDRRTGKTVAVKIVDADKADSDVNHSSDTVADFMRETAALRALKENKAKNINLIYDAFPFDTGVWIISEYCTGGSVATLMRANSPPGLPEKYIVPIARELAEAVKWVHEAGILHRDIKVTEDGRVQLCDFGISAILEHKVDKRSTVLGTPWWMPPELAMASHDHKISVSYGKEVDIWAYGCTLYELATGFPPNVRVHPEDLGQHLSKAVPRLEGGTHSQGLRDLIALCLEERPSDRPSIEFVQRQPYLFNSPKKYPTTSLRRLVQEYYWWERSGGQRQSLFVSGGAPAAEMPVLQDDDDWNFSITDDFDDIMEQTESRIRRPHPRQMAHPLERMFDKDDKSNYLEDRGRSDLPLRSTTSASIRDTTIDMGDYDSETGEFIIPDLNTIKGRKRGTADDDDDDDGYSSDEIPRRSTREWSSRPKTQDWKFPSMDPVPPEEGTASAAAERPRLPHLATAPATVTTLETASAPVSPPESMIDLDELPQPEPVRRMSADRPNSYTSHRQSRSVPTYLGLEVMSAAAVDKETEPWTATVASDHERDIYASNEHIYDENSKSYRAYRDWDEEEEASKMSRRVRYDPRSLRFFYERSDAQATEPVPSLAELDVGALENVLSLHDVEPPSKEALGGSAGGNGNGSAGGGDGDDEVRREMERLFGGLAEALRGFGEGMALIEYV